MNTIPRFILHTTLCLSLLALPLLHGEEAPSLPAVNQLGFHVFKYFSQQQKESYKSFTFSPLNMVSSLELIKGLSPESSRQQIETILGSGKNYDTLTQCLPRQNSRSHTATTNFFLFINNKFKMPKGYPYTKLAVRKDFTHGDKLVEEINQWVQYKSEGGFTSSFTPEQIHPQLRFILTSILDVRLTWEFPFYRNKTKNSKFYIAPGHSLIVPMMKHDLLPCAHGKEKGYSFVSIPCKPNPDGHQIAMTCIMPTTRQSLQDFIARLTQEQLKKILATPKSDQNIQAYIVLYLPRFGNKSKAMDMISPVSSFPALEGCFTTLPEERGIWKQSCIIRVSEEGVRARAIDESTDPFGGGTQTYIFNRPFMWVIHDTTEPLMLFMGVFSPQPTKN